ncbi:MAG: OmpA family protein [Planctomycetota bacterium]
MSWIKTASQSALAAGAILLAAGCTSKKDVAIAAKDDTIRRQEAAIAAAESERAAGDQQNKLAAEQALRNAELNRQLAAQNDQLATHSAQKIVQLTQVTNESNQRMAAMQSEVANLEGLVKGLNRGGPSTVVVQQPGQPINHDRGETGGLSRSKDGSIHIQVAGSVLFEAGRAELKAGSSDSLMRYAQMIKQQFPNNSIRIEGHTDSTPVVHSKDRYPDNMALSQARAAAVYDFLAKRGGISSGKMYTAGYGDRQPLVTPERTAADRSKNRRVEIVILPNNLKVQKDQLAQANGQARPYQTAAAVPAVQK